MEQALATDRLDRVFQDQIAIDRPPLAVVAHVGEVEAISTGVF